MIKTSWLLCALRFVAVIVACSLALSAQNEDPEMNSPLWNVPLQHSREEPSTKPLVFKAESHFVLVPVIVTDAQGLPVRGLLKESFTVLENGKQQSIASLLEITPTANPVKRPQAQRTPDGLVYEASNLYEVGNELNNSPRRITVIALDLVNTPHQNQAQAQDAMLKLLADGIDGNSLVQLVAIRGSGVSVIQNYTDDPKALVEAVRRFSARIHENRSADLSRQDILSLDKALDFSDPATREIFLRIYSMYQEGLDMADNDQQRHRIADALEGFEFIANSLSGIPGRKSLIWLTASFEMANQTLASFTRFQRAMQALAAANVAVYPVDVRGLVGIGLSSGMLEMTQVERLTTNRTREFLRSLDVKQADTIDTMKTVADATGGKAFYNSNNLASGIREASQDGSSYYMLSYKTNTKDTHAGWRKLDVKVANKGASVRARRGFYLTQNVLEPALSREEHLRLALESPLNFTGIPVTVQWKLTPGALGKRIVKYELTTPADSLQVDARAHSIDYDLAFLATTKKGEPAASKIQRFKSKITQVGMTQLKESGLTYRNEFALPSGEYGVRFAIRDNSTGRIGSVWATVTVR